VALHAALEQRRDVAVVGVGREGKSAAVVHEFLELGGLVEAELVDGHLLLLALDVIIFLVLGAPGKTLPWERAAEEVQQDVADGLKIVTPRLLVANMRVDGGVPGRARQVFALTERDVLTL